MYRPLSIALVLLACTRCFGATVEEIAENAIPSVVQIVTYDITGDQRGQGSGFFISPRKIITNEHVVDGAYSAEVFTDEGYYDLITILNAHEDMDLAILSVDAENEVPLQTNPDAELKPGQHVIAIGNPLGLEKTLSDGLISAVRTIDQLQILQITAPISPGSSGGPLLDQDGRVVGVVSATMREGQNLNFAIGVQTLSQFLVMEERPEELKVAGSRVLWRVIVKWIVIVIVGLIALAFGGGWWVIFIAIMIIVLLSYALSWVCKSIYRLVTLPFRQRHRSTSIADHESESPQGGTFTPSYTPDPTFDDDIVDENDDYRTLHCWKCGSANYFDPDTDEEIVCSECATTLPVPQELRNGEQIQRTR